MQVDDLATMLAGLHKMACDIDRQHWWRFPGEHPVAGFMGTGCFIVGDQPSTSEWGPKHPNRRKFYDLLPQIGMANAHLTDLYKKPGKARSLRNSPLPEDFSEHIKFFRAELALLKPVGVIALGDLSYDLLKHHVPEVRKILSKMRHFAAWDTNERLPMAQRICPKCSHEGRKKMTRWHVVRENDKLYLECERKTVCGWRTQIVEVATEDPDALRIS
jgi:hypothetical protein